MFASLPMYLTAENRTAHDALWAGIRRGLAERGIAAPDGLDHDTPAMEGWAREDLVLGQICNLPYRARFRDRLTLIGAGDYGVSGEAPGYYHSVFVTRADDAANSLADCGGYGFAFNEGLSQSGWAAPNVAAAAAGISLRPVLRTGAHRASMAAVAEGRADLAAIDCITYAIASDIGLADGLKVIGRSTPSPGMSFVTGSGRDPEPFRLAIAEAIAGLATSDAIRLRLRGVIPLPTSAYDLPLPPEPVIHAEGPVATRLAGRTRG